MLRSFYMTHQITFFLHGYLVFQTVCDVNLIQFVSLFVPLVT